MTLASGRRLGRYRLISPLGRGAQASVWRSHDERLDRAVALKLLDPGATDLAPGAAGPSWLQEARAVGRLAHPHIVPVFDAEQIDGHDCLAFELVEGMTLAALLRQRGRLPAREAVEMMLGLIDALRAAHAQGIVHRDLKPSNILVDAGGRARVMDFGIAARLGGEADGGSDPLAGFIVGTPGYLSPEAAAAAAPSGQMDVFAAGLVLGELLAGARLVAEREPRAALRRVLDDDLLLPEDADADDRLRAIVQRAIARDPAARYDSAASLRDALMQWLAPPDEHSAGAGHGTLDFLLRRMRHKSDFPALTGHVLRIQRLASSDSESLGTLADEILKDVALTQKLLRMVNTAHYRRNGHGVATVSRAVAMVGLAGIRNLALSLVLVEHMKDKAHAQRLKEEFLRSMLAAQLAHALSAGARDAEEAFLGAMFYNLGKLLTEYYFPDEADAIRAQLRLSASPADARLHPDRLADRAAQTVLGLGFEGLGMGVARHWSLPDSLQRCMRRPDGPLPAQPLAPGPERLRWLSVAANEVADAVWHADDADLPPRLEAILQRHGRGLALALPELRRAVDAARGVLVEMAPAMGLVLPRSSRGAELLAAAPDVAATESDVLAANRLAPTAVTAAPTRPGLAPAGRPAEGVSDVLAAGIQDITDTMAGETFRLNEVLRMVLETMYRALGFQRMVFCLREPSGSRLQGRFGLGQDAAVLSPQFSVPLRWDAHQSPDLFGAVCVNGSDTLIADARAPAIAKRLPNWYRERVDAPSFLLLPMRMKQAPFGLIYADHARAGAMQVSERELALLRTLRNQAVMAFRQHTPQG
jgi:serine/threonine protein kinase